MFPLCQMNKPTGTRGLTPHMSNLANEVKLGHREPLVYATKKMIFTLTISSYICKISPTCFSISLTKVINMMLQFHENVTPVQRIIATRVKQKCICSEKLAFITAAGDHGTAVASDKYIRVSLISKKWTNIREASGWSTAPNAAKTISREAWNSPVKYPLWEHKFDKR